MPAKLASSVARDHAHGGKSPLQMNGLRFQHGLGVGASSRIDLKLDGGWRLLRSDLGVDDSCRDAGSLHFQVWSGDRLLYDSGTVKAPGVVKPELDIRGVHNLSLRTLGAQSPKVCGNWANALLIGQQGDSAEISTTP